MTDKIYQFEDEDHYEFIYRLCGIANETDTTWLSGEYDDMIKDNLVKLMKEARRWSKDGRVTLI